jgi:hypothetical protein
VQAAARFQVAVHESTAAHLRATLLLWRYMQCANSGALRQLSALHAILFLCCVVRTQYFDNDGSGAIDAAELSKVMRGLGANLRYKP